MSSAVFRLLRIVGSHSATLAILGLMALVVVAGLAAGIVVGDWMVLPLAGLFINLLAGLVAHATLRAQPMLFAFHAMLAVLALLIGLDRLTALKGHVEITEGAMFDPSLAVIEAGPLHPYALDQITFVQGAFEIQYLPGMKRRETVSLLRVPGAAGEWHEARVGDDDPLIFGNYRFYTSFNKGFAPVITYTSADGQSVTGAVHMPSYPLRDFDQGNEWIPPGWGPDRDPVKLWLSLAEPVYDENAAWTFRKPKNPTLVVIDGEERRELTLGQGAAITGGGTIRFDGLRSWMGYTITANLFNAWMMAVAITACLALAVHLLEKLLPRPAGIEVMGARNAD
jgi:cytochrome c biogenesis protein